MKQLAVIALIGFFLFDSVGFYFLLENKIYTAKSEAREIMQSNDRDLVTITVLKRCDQQPSWTGTHEFRYQDEMFDVIYTNDEGDRIEYVCYHDEKEGDIISEAGNKLKNKTDQTSPRNSVKPRFNLSDKDFTNLAMPASPERIVICFSCIKVIFYDDAIHHKVPTPPPDAG